MYFLSTAHLNSDWPQLKVSSYMWLVTTVLNRAVLGTMRNTDQVSIIWMSWQSARRYYMCPNFSDEENETHRGCMICPKWRSNDCTARSQLCFWWDPMLGTIGLHHHHTWRDGWVEEYKFFGGYSLNSGFFIPTFFFFFPFYFPPTRKYMQTHTLTCWTNRFQLSSN